MRFSEINESINDKGIFKAVFLAGLPGAGKSTVSQRVTDGTVAPRMVNTDRSYEFLLKKHGKEADKAAWELLGKQSETINKGLLTNYLNGMLPIFVDGTSANPSSAMRRAGIVESLGYDTAMIWVDISLETALERIQTRERKVDPEFVQQVYNTIAGNKELYRSRFGSNFIEVDNNADNFSAMEGKVFNITNKFFTSPVQNQIGQRLIQQMEESGDKYLVPNVYPKEYIEKIVSVWYMK
jgi:predicted kinase